MPSLVDSQNGLVSARVFSDPALYARELEMVFGRSWLFVAHESEIPEPGDFVTRVMGEDPVIVCRDHEGQARVMLNVCRHRGRKVCLEDAGSARTFQCGYHGWTYNEAGELTGVPFFDAYGGKLDKPALGLQQAPRVASRFGLIFASWTEDGPDLDEYLGELGWILRILFARTTCVEVAGPPQRWIVDANWKLGAANFSGDGYHLPTTHGYGVALGLDASRGQRLGFVLNTGQGHCAQMRYCPPGTIDVPPYLGLPEALWPDVRVRLSPEQLEVMNSHLPYTGNVFPNMSFICVATVGFLNTEYRGEGAGPESPVSFLSVRQWQPKGPSHMEVWSWLLMDRDVSPAWKEASKACYERAFGMAGMHEQDDVENWSAITRSLHSPRASKVPLNYQMRLDASPSPEWRGPGKAYLYPTFSEINERAFYQAWQDRVSA